MASFFSTLVEEPPNNILGVAGECKSDPFEDKINLVIGAYRTEEGKPYVLPSVRAAEDFIHSQNLDHEYLVQDGHADFNRSCQKLMFGDEFPAITENRIYTVQAVAGTGAVRLGSDFIQHSFPNVTTYIPDVTWGNHAAILKSSGNKYGSYRYLDAAGTGFNYEGMIADLELFPEGSIILLHSCAHNPTGVDPTDDQWLVIKEVMKRRRLMPFFDNAYQGFVTGDVHKDAFAVRCFAQDGLELLVACSFSKNFGLYGERIGALHVVTRSAEESRKAGSIIRALARELYSTCPSHGARIVAHILGDGQRRLQWEEECRAMAQRLSQVRATLYQLLQERRVRGTWEHIIMQRGMFTYSGIKRADVDRLKKEHHVYMLPDGRVSLAGLNQQNINRFADALQQVLGTN